jgi:hypothetical protein
MQNESLNQPGEVESQPMTAAKSGFAPKPDSNFDINLLNTSCSIVEQLPIFNWQWRGSNRPSSTVLE